MSLDEWTERLAKVNEALAVANEAISFGARLWSEYSESPCGSQPHPVDRPGLDHPVAATGGTIRDEDAGE